MRRIFVLAILSALLFTSCRHIFGKRVRGNGNITTLEHGISGYNSIDVSSSIDVYVSQGDVQQVKVETDDNLQDYIAMREEGGTLYISIEKGYNPRPTKGIKVFVTGPSFRKFEASGSCDLYTQNMITSTESIAIDLSGSCDAKMELKAPKIVAEVTGSGSVTLKGETKDLEMEGTGSSTFKSLEMMAENVEVDISGSGDAEVFASNKLDVEVAGSGSVRYRGNPSVKQHTAGSGRIEKID